MRGTTRTEPKTSSVPTEPASAPSAGPSRAPATAVPSAVPITLPRLSSGAEVISQVSAPAQIRAPAMPWVKRAASSRSSSATWPERTGGGRRARRVGGGEDAGLRLAEPELVDVVRQQRRDRREEGDVEEDHRRGQPEQAPHAPIQSVARGH